MTDQQSNVIGEFLVELGYVNNEDAQKKFVERQIKDAKRRGCQMPEYFLEQVAELKAGLKKGRLRLAAARAVL